VYVSKKDGRIRIFRYPCLVKAAPNVTVVAHAGPVGLVRFTCDGKYLLSVGKEDRSLLAWKLVKVAGDKHALLMPANGAMMMGDSASSSSSSSSSASSANGSTYATTAQTANGLIGANVIIHGMIDNIDLNGCEGLVLDYRSHPTRRYTVKVEGTDPVRVLLIKPGNLKKAPVVPKTRGGNSRRSQYHK
jgi:WD40 repeat protein